MDQRVSSEKFAMGIALALALAAVAVGLWLPRQDLGQKLTVATVKLLAMSAVAVTGWLRWRTRPEFRTTGRWVLAGLSAEAVCDFAIELSVVAGGIASTVGMVFYSLAFASYPQKAHGARSQVGWTVLLAGLFLVSAWGIRSAVGQTLGWADGAYTVYMVILSATAALSLSRQVPWTGRLAILLFYVSDYVVYMGGVWGSHPGLAILNAVTYYPAQFLFAVGLASQRIRPQSID